MKGFNFAGINSKDKPKYYQEKATRDWMRLYEGYPNLSEEQNEYLREIAIELINYSFLQSGFNPNLNQFYTYIPQAIMRDQGFTKEISSMFDLLRSENGELGDISIDDNMIDQIARHESENTKIIMTMSSESNESTDPYIFIPNDYAVSRMGTSGQGEFKSVKEIKFINVSYGKDSSVLFEYAGDSKIPVTGTDMMRPLYAKTFKLGKKVGKNKITEYSYGNNLKESMLKENKILPAVQEQIEKQVKDNSYQKEFVSLGAQGIYEEESLTKLVDDQAVEDQQEAATALSFGDLFNQGLGNSDPESSFRIDEKFMEDNGIEETGCNN